MSVLHIVLTNKALVSGTVSLQKPETIYCLLVLQEESAVFLLPVLRNREGFKKCVTSTVKNCNTTNICECVYMKSVNIMENRMEL